jgi:hypothetical protein
MTEKSAERLSAEAILKECIHAQELARSRRLKAEEALRVIVERESGLIGKKVKERWGDRVILVDRVGIVAFTSISVTGRRVRKDGSLGAPVTLWGETFVVVEEANGELPL